MRRKSVSRQLKTRIFLTWHSGAAEDDEMSGQMITRGWRIKLEANNRHEYRADKNQVRLYKFKGKNYLIVN